MAEIYTDNTIIPKPNRFLVSEDLVDSALGSQTNSSGLTQTLVIERESTVPVPNTNESQDMLIDNEELMERMKALFPDLGFDIEQLGTIIRDYSYTKSAIEQLEDKISLMVTEGSESDIIGVGGLDGLYQKFDEVSAEIELMKDNINLAVNNTDYDSLETYIDSSVSGFVETFRENVTIIADQLIQTTAQIEVMRSKIELSVGEVDATGVYTNSTNEEKASTWSNTVGIYDASLQGFEYTSASGWTGTGVDGDMYALKFNGNQYLSINNPMKDDTIYDQSFTVDTFMTLRSAHNQKLTNLGSGMYLANEIGLPSFFANTGSKEISFIGNDTLPSNTLLHVSYLFDAQLRAIQMYVNGEAYGGSIVWKSDESSAMPPSILIGQGMICDLYIFRLYDRLLGPEEIRKSHQESLMGVAYTREGLVVSLDGRKSQSLSSSISKSLAEIKLMKDSIVSRVTRDEMNTAIASSSGYVVIFSNENQTFATEHDGSLSQAIIIETDIDVFKGATRISAVIGSPILKNHLGGLMDFGTMSVVNPTADRPGKFTWNLPSGTNISADYGWIEMIFTMDTLEIVKKITWSKAKRGITGPQGTSNYKVDVLSTAGLLFTNGQINTVLYARIYYGDEDITNEIPEDRCIWTRVSDNESSDLEWNIEHLSGRKTIYVDSNDVNDRATFSCDLIGT